MGNTKIMFKDIACLQIACCILVCIDIILTHYTRGESKMQHCFPRSESSKVWYVTLKLCLSESRHSAHSLAAHLMPLLGLPLKGCVLCHCWASATVGLDCHCWALPLLGYTLPLLGDATVGLFTLPLKGHATVGLYASVSCIFLEKIG